MYWTRSFCSVLDKSWAWNEYVKSFTHREIEADSHLKVVEERLQFIESEIVELFSDIVIVVAFSGLSGLIARLGFIHVHVGTSTFRIALQTGLYFRSPVFYRDTSKAMITVCLLSLRSK